MSFKVLEVVDDKLEKADVTFVKFSDDDVAEEEFGLTPEQMPKLIFFDNQIPVKQDHNMISLTLTQSLIETLKLVKPDKELMQPNADRPF